MKFAELCSDAITDLHQGQHNWKEWVSLDSSGTTIADQANVPDAIAVLELEGREIPGNSSSTSDDDNQMYSSDEE